MTHIRRPAFDSATLAFLSLLIVITALRVWALRLDPLDLYFDEAQYWAWSRTLDWGYFTKPPMIAWVIAATTALFGDSEWAVRLGAPLAHALTALAAFALGRAMYGAWAGFWAGLGWLALFSVWLSSYVISTDALLLPFWALGMLALWRLTETRAWPWALALGAAVGLGVLAKYAMLYFPLCLLLAARWAPPVRESLRQGRGLAAALVALVLVAPNIIWNAQHGFATAAHTAANARIDAANLFNFDELFEFWGSQAGIVGPLVFIALAWLLFRAVRHGEALRDEDKFLLAFALPPLAFVSVIAFISRANANWAVAAYPAAIVWIAGSLFTTIASRRALAAITLTNLVTGAAVATLLIVGEPASTNALKGVRESRAWEETAQEIALRAAAQPGEAPFSAVLVDDRATFYELTYYWRNARRAGAPLPPLRMWLLHARAGNSAETSNPMRAEEGGRVLVVHLRPDLLPFVAGDFTTFRTVEHLAIPLGGEYARAFEISIGEGFAPSPRDAAFEERLQRRHEP